MPKHVEFKWMDILYGISAGLLVIVGLLRVFYFEKGAAFYAQNWFFWTKMLGFALAALLSIYPTIRFVSWRKFLARNQVPEISDQDVARIKMILRLEMAGDCAHSFLGGHDGAWRWDDVRVTDMIVLSHFQAGQILEARRNGHPVVTVSLDLNLTESEVRLQPEYVLFPAGESLDWKSIEEISGNETACYTVEEHAAKAIKGFSEFSGRVYGLMPTASAPTMLISGIPMHRIKDTNPHQDTLNKIKAIAPVKGDVLDTTTGLGYTAIEAAKTARQRSDDRDRPHRAGNRPAESLVTGVVREPENYTAHRRCFRRDRGIGGRVFLRDHP